MGLWRKGTEPEGGSEWCTPALSYSLNLKKKSAFKLARYISSCPPNRIVADLIVLVLKFERMILIGNWSW